MLHAVIMAGGAGTRFWPASRASQPKQLLKLVGDRTMIQATCDRLVGLVPLDRTLVVTGASLSDAVAAQLPDLSRSSIIGEPCKRDTAPCVGLSAGLIASRDPEAVLVVMPADHVIEPTEEFQRAIRGAVELVASSPETLVTFGIKPTCAATNYGYIERGAAWDTSPGGIATYRVARFREKPSLEVAEEFLRSGQFYWNAGIFVWKARTILDALRKFEPDIVEHLDRIIAAAETPRFEELLAHHFTAIQGKSIDYAVLESYPEVAVMETTFAWDDVGNWQSLARTRGTDDHGNTSIGKHVAINTCDSIICTGDQHLVVTVGLQSCIVVHTPDATLVANKHDEEAMRQVVARLRELGWDQYL